ncbi:MAG TPA: thioesterase domain-containing protein, partial [Candidatus Elarobacter sp.]|nr:thioesterase domain-containing protein [Candidatus Elarobacter sp.]
TAERFVADPFSPIPDARLYRTGDIARWLPNGALEFLGRIDHQVKLRGVRIELGEIEAALVAHPDVRDAAVIAREHGPDDVRLVAYVIAYDQSRASDAVLRAHLQKSLPAAMIPSSFVMLDTLPLSANGKLDRRALPAPESAGAPAHVAYAPPRTAIEHGLVEIWESLLPRRPIGVHDDFFEIGGHSLLALRMLSSIERAFGQRLPLAALFEASTINGLGLLLESAVRDTDEPPSVVIHETAPGRPFAFVHGDLRGGGWYCRRLAPMLGADVPFILFRAFSADAPNGPASIEAMAAANVRELQRIQLHGPYRLGGFCVGGLIAFEMARLLRASGEVVDRLILIDTSAGNARFRWLEPLLHLLVRATHDDDERRLDRRARILRQLRYYTRRVQEVRDMSRPDQLRWLRTNVARYTPGVRAASDVAPREDRSSDAAELADEFQLRPGTRAVQFHARAAAAFIPRAYAGEVDVINCTDALAPTVEQAARDWGRITRTVRVHTVDSSHLGLLTSDLPALAARMRECLSGRTPA